jgi:hypothetical protein
MINYIGADKFKVLAEVFEPDTRIKFWSEGETRKSFDHFYAAISKIELNDYVERDVLRQFETAKNVLLYSYFSYSMSSVAILQGYASLEKAIKLKATRLGLISSKKVQGKLSEKAGLSEKIDFALKRKWLGKKHFYLFDHAESDICPKVIDLRISNFVGLRNTLAHDPSFLNILWQVPEQLQLIANLINAVLKFDDLENKEVPEIFLPKQTRPKLSTLFAIHLGMESNLTFSSIHQDKK